MLNRHTLVPLAAVAGAALLTGVGSSGALSATPDPNTTLRLGYYEDIQSPDPDVQYDIPGMELVNNTYEGLVQYAPGNSTKIIPWLATSWTISPDDTVYTLHLRHGVTFHDGTPFNSAAAKASFERRIKMNQGTLYQVQDIKSMATPDPYTLVITLGKTVSAFMDYLASPYGTKMISPTAISANSKSNDLGQHWLATHDAGTGPYTITQFTLGQQYVEQAYSKWWGSAPYYKTVIYKLIPDAGSQILQLRGGDLDILHQQPGATVDKFKHIAGYQVQVFPVFLKTWMHVNPNRPPFSDPALRKVLGQAINRALLTRIFFGNYGTTSTSMYPAGMLPSSLGADPQPYDPSKLKALVANLPAADRGVSLVYLSGHGADIGRISDGVGSELSQAGLKVTVTEITVAQLFNYPSENPKTVPQLFIGSENPDSASPDTWARSYMYKGAALNYFAGSVPEADQAMDKGLSDTNEQQLLVDYGRAGDIIHDAGTFITIADADDTFIARAGISGWAHQLECTTCINLATLRPSAN
jgi:peptide/nickel transport system substrate-binding protein